MRPVVVRPSDGLGERFGLDTSPVERVRAGGVYSPDFAVCYVHIFPDPAFGNPYFVSIVLCGRSIIVAYEKVRD